MTRTKQEKKRLHEGGVWPKMRSSAGLSTHHSTRAPRRVKFGLEGQKGVPK